MERQALAAVLEALDLPHAATAEGEAVRAAVLEVRTRYAVSFLRGFLRDGVEADEQRFELRYLAERLAEHPAAGYVTAEQARARLAAGADWAEAVRVEEGAA